MEVDWNPNPWLEIADRLSLHAEAMVERAQKKAEVAQNLADFLKKNPRFSPANPEEFAGGIYGVLDTDRHTCWDLVSAIYKANPNYAFELKNRLVKDLVTRTRKSVEDAEKVHRDAKFFRRQHWIGRFKKMKWF